MADVYVHILSSHPHRLRHLEMILLSIEWQVDISLMVMLRPTYRHVIVYSPLETRQV